MPRIWVHPESWQPIDFEDYLAISRLVRGSDRKVLVTAPSVRDLIGLDYEEQCAGDTQLLQQLKSFIGDKNDMHATDWNGMANFMCKRLASAISTQ